MKRPSQHIEWLSLIEVSGPFLAVGLLEKAFPQGLEAVETPRRHKLRAAYDEWCEAIDEDDAQLLALHREWVQLVLADILEYSQEVLFENSAFEEPLEYRDPEHGVAFAPSLVVRSDGDTKPRLLISVYPPGTDLEKVKTNDGWPVSLMERMVLLCRSTGVRLGLLTNGDRWMLVNAPVGATSSHASWYARLWFQEPLTLKAFQSLLGIRRFFGPKDETLDSLLEKSLEYQEEVTDTLGAQVRRAVEVLVQCLDKADQDRNRELLRDVSPSELYEAGLTVMMRLVFVLCAEERGLLLLGDQVYDQCYAVSTLRGHLGEDADRHGPEVLERRHDAWTRLLSVFRAVYGGIEHESLRLPAMGGSLFDPDRFPFLEGRLKDTRWRETPAAPLPIDNRTVLLLLEALQVLEQPGGALLLSYRALDVEQIGHVYEGLLEHTVARVPHITVGLAGSKKAKNPNLPLADLESVRMDGEAALLRILLEATQRSEPALRRDLQREIDTEDFGRVLLVCGGDMDLAERIRPFANLLRTDAWGEPIVYRANSFMVTLGADRRDTGTHYTPKSLTENIVSTTLGPLAYIGPSEGFPRAKWRLKSSSELLSLKVCDLAMGSGAFLVQACRWLGERVVEAWSKDEAAGKVVTVDGETLNDLGEADPMPSQVEDRLIMARRLVAERCLYGIDINPLAVELAKLSIWLVTLAKGRPFGFLDHNLRHGDTLLGIHRLDQLTRLSFHPEKESHVLPLLEQMIETPVIEAIEFRKQLRSVPIRDIGDVEAMRRLDREARKSLESVELVADAMIGEVFVGCGNARELETRLNTLATHAGEYLNGADAVGRQIARKASENLAADLPDGRSPRRPFHWALEFPEVFLSGGFDGIVGNPPFLGGQRITGIMGTAYRNFLVAFLADGERGSADLVAYFFLRAYSLLKQEGAFGLLAVNTIAEGDTRQVGLERMVKNGAVIFAAYPNEPWPGQAAVVTSRVHIYKGNWRGSWILAERTCTHISAFLSDREDWSPKRLKANEGRSFQGSIVLGMGFVLAEHEARAMIVADPRNAEVLFPYLNGEDLNSSPDQKASRWVINFWDWPEHQAKEHILPYQRVQELVKPERERLNDTNPTSRRRKEKWWQFGADAKNLYHAIGYGDLFVKHPTGWKHIKRPLGRVLLVARVSKTLAFSFVNARSVFADQTVVFSFEEAGYFALLQSSIHSVFAWQHSSKLKNDLRYSPSDAFGTFPFPDAQYLRKGSIIDTHGEFYHATRASFMRERGIGLTRFYRRFHDLDDSDPQIITLRELHRQIDVAVSEAYGWDTLDLGHDFHKVPYLPENDRLRYTISEPARFEILRRLAALNKEQYEEEVRQGLQKTGAERETHDEE